MKSNTQPSNDDGPPPIAVSVAKACELSGFGPTSIWAFLKNGRLQAVRVPGVRRTLVSYPSLARLLVPPSSESTPPPRHQHRARKCQQRVGGHRG